MEDEPYMHSFRRISGPLTPPGLAFVKDGQAIAFHCTLWHAPG